MLPSTDDQDGVCILFVNLLFRHLLLDVLCLDGKDVAVFVAKAESAIGAAPHNHEASEREVESTHEFLCQWRYFAFCGVNFYCCHIV